ncbi:peptidoglycan DD-metalloendopeptidase family protein [Paenibacillus sp. S-38]|uniref:peptidoglycan DD-metalloendopeptidase family protein n=1 Tax=Paenibacillus sp. S-38 TaxID=3416710 RepID=UPI003CFAB6CC
MAGRNDGREPAGLRHRRKGPKRPKPLPLLGWALAAAGASVVLAILVREPEAIRSQPEQEEAAYPAAAAVAPARREPVEFRMTDLDHGWIRYKDVVRTTSDGGVTWTDRGAVPAAREPDAGTEGQGLPGGGTEAEAGADAGHRMSSLRYHDKDYAVKQVQFLTEEIGWALVQDDGELGGGLLVSGDGGRTWQQEVTGLVRDAIRRAKEELAGRRKEAPLYASAEAAQLAFRSEWLVMPETAVPGGVVLIRHKKPGSVYWNGRTYLLEPYGAGYFTYLPIGMDVAPGRYPIGDKTLTIAPKRYPSQYLEVTEEMNRMRQDTKRIAADQALINKARSVSQTEFLADGPYVIPVDGRLTTPYGHTRYVNGKFSGAHLAVDLAAPEGTPVKAANDGVVALADSLYLTGNSIYLDHGMGLFSQYAHLSKLQVKAGDRVRKGEIIGLVGTTGFSTGPHLHFAFWAHNVQVDPNLFFGRSPFHWLLGTEAAGEGKIGQ